MDGDDTGRELERFFQAGLGSSTFKRFSKAIDSAIQTVAKRLTGSPINGQIIFSSGDNILFRGIYETDAIEELRSTYVRMSGGRTCSVGFGGTPKEAYVALKMAKATLGKNSVMGVTFVDSVSEAPAEKTQQGDDGQGASRST